MGDCGHPEGAWIGVVLKAQVAEATEPANN